MDTFLGKIEMEQPGIPAGYAASFFLREPARADEPTPDEIRTNIAKLEAELTEQKELLKKLEEEAEAERIAEEARKAQAQEAELLEAQAEALLAKATELKKHAQKK